MSQRRAVLSRKATRHTLGLTAATALLTSAALGAHVGMATATEQDSSVTALVPADPELSELIAGFTPPDCTSGELPVSVEATRLTAVLPDDDDPSQPAHRTWARTMVEGGGFDTWTSDFAEQLCDSSSLDEAHALIQEQGEALWNDAVQRAQATGSVEGDLPSSDDRPLYWVREEAKSVLYQWSPSFTLTTTQRMDLVDDFDRAGRGMYAIDFPEDEEVQRIIVSGFDPYTLDGGETGPADGTVGNNIRHGNPSGASALALDGTEHVAADGTVTSIEAYTLPVNYPEFERGYLEDTVGPFMLPGTHQVDASITISQAGGSQFNLEQWNSRYHGLSVGNDRYAGCERIDDELQIAVDNPECNTQVVERWGGGATLFDPPQWTEASMPISEMIAANTGKSVERPEGSTWPDESVAFGVVWNTNYSYFPNCDSNGTVTVDQRKVVFPPPVEPIAPPEDSCAFSGAGGTYLSNESAYRNTLLRDRLDLNIPAGHIHTPGMQHFRTPFAPSDDLFDQWRTSIVAQTRNLIHVIAETEPEPEPAQVVRIDGEDRYDTAAQIAEEFPEGANTVYVANGLSEAQGVDALVTGAVAGGGPGVADDGPAPILLIKDDAIPAAAAQALEDLDPERIVVVGGPQAVHPSVETELGQAGTEVSRIGGADRFETAVALTEPYPSGGTVYVAAGTGPDDAEVALADALTAASVAGHHNVPVLLTQDDNLPKVTEAALADLAPSQIVLVGGPVAVNEDVEEALTQIAPTTRQWGESRYETAVALTAEYPVDSDRVYVASGTNFPDALVGAALASSQSAPLLITRSDRLPQPVSDEVTRLSPQGITIFGGPTAVEDVVEESLQAILDITSLD